MTSTTVFSDVVLPAATWYEKHDLTTTDMHPFVHSFNPAIAPPWQTRTDFDVFADDRARRSAGWPGRISACAQDVVAVPLLHDTADEHGDTRTAGCVDWKDGECEPVPGRHDAEAGRRGARLPGGRREDGRARPAPGPARRHHQGRHLPTSSREVDYLGAKNGAVRGGPPTAGRRCCATSHACETILALSGTTNGHLAAQGFRTLERRTGTELADLAAEHEGKRITFADTQARAGAGHHLAGVVRLGVRAAAATRPFTINVERLKPWHTLTGRQHFFLDHDWMTELGESLPVYRPPLDMAALFGEPSHRATPGELGVTVRYLTPH